MAFFNSAIGVLQTLVIALGAGLGIGVLSISWRATATTILARMLIYHKEVTSNNV